MATVSYFLRTKSANSKIQVQLSVSRDLKLRTSTDLIINSEYWSDDTKLPKGKSVEIRNLQNNLRELENHILNEYNSDFSKGVIFETVWLKEKISKFFKRIDIKEDDSVFHDLFK